MTALSITAAVTFGAIADSAVDAQSAESAMGWRIDPAGRIVGTDGSGGALVASHVDALVLQDGGVELAFDNGCCKNPGCLCNPPEAV